MAYDLLLYQVTLSQSHLIPLLVSTSIHRTDWRIFAMPS